MSALDEMEERNQRLAYERGLADGAKREREWVLKEFERRLQSREIIRDGEGERCVSYELIEDMLANRPDRHPKSLCGHEGGQR